MRVSGNGIVLVDRPVEPGHAVVALDADTLEHDVVTGFTVIIRVVSATVKHIMADNRAVKEQFRVFARKRIKSVATFEPVIAFVASDKAWSVSGHRKVVAVA